MCAFVVAPSASLASIARWRRPGPSDRRGIASPSPRGARSHRRGPPASASASASPSLSDLLADLRDAAGDKNGTDLDDAQRARVASILADVESLADDPAPARKDLSGTVWSLLYTDSGGNSSGKIGPFVGRVTQVFAPAPGEGRYRNVVEIGPVVVELSAVAEEVRPDTLKVTFLDTAARAFGRELVRKPFPRGRAGTWRMAYVGEDARVLYTNQGNVFVLVRER